MTRSFASAATAILQRSLSTTLALRVRTHIAVSASASSRTRSSLQSESGSFCAAADTQRTEAATIAAAAQRSVMISRRLIVITPQLKGIVSRWAAFLKGLNIAPTWPRGEIARPDAAIGQATALCSCEARGRYRGQVLHRPCVLPARFCGCENPQARHDVRR